MNSTPRLGWLGLTAVLWLAWPARAQDGEISAENWTQRVAFRPNLALVPGQPGKQIDTRNVADFEGVLPEGMKLLVRNYGLKLKLAAYRPVHPSEGYIQATNRHRGKARLLEAGDAHHRRGIDGYVAGLPFPGPSNGLEVAWNFMYAYGGDDSVVTYGVYWVSAGSGLEHTEEWRLSTIRGTHRTDIEPIPAIESFEKRGLQGAGLTYALAPYDKKGFGAVYFRHIEPRDSQGHTYVPSMRRVIKNSFGTRGDTWNATDLLYEDVRGYSGYPEWMHWKLEGKRTVLLPMHAGVKLGKQHLKKTYDFTRPPHWNPNYAYEPRPVFALEARPKLPDYPYSKQYLYVDGETFQILYKEAFDRKGELWKIMINSATFHSAVESDEEILGWSGTVIIDLQAEHATLFHVHQARHNLGLDPDQFTVSSLRKRSR